LFWTRLCPQSAEAACALPPIHSRVPPGPPKEGSMAWPVRYKMIALLFCGTVVNYVDRVNISVAAPIIMKETGWPKDLFGWVFSSFLVEYAFLQRPRGAVPHRSDAPNGHRRRAS